MDGFKDRLTPKTVWIDDWTEQETLCYDALLEMLRGTYRRSLGAATPIARPSGIEEHVSQFVLVSMLIMREMASHTAAAMKTLDTALRGHLEKLALALGDRTGLESLDQFLKVHSKNLKHEDTHGKAKALLDELENLFDDTHSVLVYVVFRETLTAVSELIKKRFPDIEVIEYHGKLSKEDKKRQVRRFWKSKKACFVSMDSGGQGLNLQVADTVVNYDYPWNPMKVEQRVGRVDRYGQTSDNIRIVNFITRGTIEVYVYHTLQSKLEVFRNVIGDMMSPLQVEELWEDRLMLGIGELILSSRDADDMRARFEGLDESSLRKYLDRYERYVARSEKWVGK
jgi:SNF2 family DNA or RNA helicase